MQAGLAGIQQQDYKKAQQDLENSYRREPIPAVLGLLGQLAERQGQVAAAADLYRRFLEEDPSAAPSRQQQLRLISEAQRQTSEVAVSGEPGAFLRVDGRLVGRIPLSRALLIAPGKHRISHESGGRIVHYSLDVAAGVPASLRFVPDSAHVAVETRPPTVIVLFDGQFRPAASNTHLARALWAGLRQDGQAHDLSAERVSEGARPGCSSDDTCLVPLARRLGAHGVIALSTAASIQVSYLDARLGATTERIDMNCAGCSPERAAQTMQTTVRELMGRIVNQAYGTLDIRANPVGTELKTNQTGRSFLSPAKVPVIAGPLSLTLRKADYLPVRASLSVSADEVRAIDIALRPNLFARKRRQVTIGKWCLLAAGVLGVAGGAIGIGLNGQLEETRPNPDDPTKSDRYLFDSLTQGAVFLGLGVAALGGAIGLGIYERRLSKQAAAAEEAALQETVSQ